MTRLLKLPIVLFILILFNSCEDSIPGSTTVDPGKNGGNGLQIVSPQYNECLQPIGNATLDIVSWNIERFPKAGNTISTVKEIIANANPDIIAVQEISDLSEFNSLISQLEGWKGVAVDMGFLSLGYLYKESEVSLIGTVSTIYNSENYYFPREPLIGVFQHVNGLTVRLINIHLKAQESGDSDELRREQASNLLKAYVDSDFSDQRVLILGDFNDLLSDPPSENVFQNFIDDAENYLFTDMEIAFGSSAYWSYPEWPSHLDHLLITNELFDLHESTQTLRVDRCESDYLSVVSDHRPMLIRFKAD